MLEHKLAKENKLLDPTRTRKGSSFQMWVGGWMADGLGVLANGRERLLDGVAIVEFEASRL